jgi:hypothetical protein
VISSARHTTPGVIKSACHRAVDDLVTDFDTDTAEDHRVHDDVEVDVSSVLSAQGSGEPGPLVAGEVDRHPHEGDHPALTIRGDLLEGLDRGLERAMPTRYRVDREPHGRSRGLSFEEVAHELLPTGDGELLVADRVT